MNTSSSYDRARLQRSQVLLDPYIEKVPERPAARPKRQTRRKSPGTPLVMVLVGALGLGAGLSISSILGDRDPSEGTGSVTSLAAPNAARAQESNAARVAVDDAAEARQTVAQAAAPEVSVTPPAVAEEAPEPVAEADRPDTSAIVTGTTVRAPVETPLPRQPAPASLTATAEEEAVPDAADARWARDVVAKPARSLDELADMAGDGEAGDLLALGQPPSDARTAPFPTTGATAEDDLEPDAERTAAIPPQSAEPVAVSGSGRPVARNVKVNDHVNLRARGQSGSRVISVVPKGSTVGLVGCDVWCEIVVGGTRGYVFRSFIEGQGGAARRAAATSAPAQAESDEAAESQAAQAQRPPQSIDTPVFDQGTRNLP